MDDWNDPPTTDDLAAQIRALEGHLARIERGLWVLGFMALVVLLKLNNLI